MTVIRVILTTAPESLLQGLPEEDQAEIKAIVGRPVTLVGYQAELQFTDSKGDRHTIWVDANLIKSDRPPPPPPRDGPMIYTVVKGADFLPRWLRRLFPRKPPRFPILHGSDEW